MVFNFDLSRIITAGCVVDIDLHDRLLFVIIGPIVAVAMLGVTYRATLLQNRECDKAHANVRQKHVSAVLLSTFFGYSSVSYTLFQTFACDSLEDGSIYLRADYHIHCDSPKHEALTIYAADFMAVLYSLSIPVLYASLLFKDRRVLAKGSGKVSGNSRKYSHSCSSHVPSISSLWKPLFKPKVFYYEVIECCRRILLTGVVVFIYPDT